MGLKKGKRRRIKGNIINKDKETMNKDKERMAHPNWAPNGLFPGVNSVKANNIPELAKMIHDEKLLSVFPIVGKTNLGS